MKLSEEDIRHFQILFEKESGRPISQEEAQEYAEALINLINIFKF